MKEKILHLPVHVALIMDGNGRWAKKRLMPRTAGHSAGMNRMIGLAEKAKEMGIRYMTVYALSTENLARPQEELDGLFGLFRKYFSKNVQKLHKNGASVKVIGDIAALPQDIVSLIAESEKGQPENAAFTFVIALNYGARSEITYAVNRAVRRCLEERSNGVDGGPLTQSDVSALLYTDGLPDPDLIIRTGGEKRLSNFLLYQAAYAELYFTDILFPDFSDGDFVKAVEDYSLRTRRFGKV